MKTIKKYTCKDGLIWYEIDFGTYKLITFSIWELLSQVFNQKLILN
jgi:hypothetical protein